MRILTILSFTMVMGSYAYAKPADGRTSQARAQSNDRGTSADRMARDHERATEAPRTSAADRHGAPAMRH